MTAKVHASANVCGTCYPRIPFRAGSATNLPTINQNTAGPFINTFLFFTGIYLLIFDK
jgi:hypothetical protein